MHQPLVKAILICSVLLLNTNTLAKDDKAKPQIKSQKITSSIYFLSGKGGNVGVSIGADGTFLIDDKFAPMTETIIKEIKTLGGDAPKFVINTHWHGDHTGGNENLGKQGAIIVAHDNVRKRLSTDNFISAFNMKSKAYAPEGLPVITFTQGMTFHLNNDEIDLIHIANAHTDGDSIVHFKKANVLHAGDVFFNGFYPFIDIHHGGSLKGMLDAANKVLSIVDDKTKIIPGHGPIANKADLKRYRDMLKTVYKRLSKLKADGKSVKEAIAAQPLQSLEKEWADGIFKTNKWIALIYAGLD